MQVDPARLVELAAASESILTSMADDWAAAQHDLTGACDALGDALGTLHVQASYADSLADAAEVVVALTHALDLGVTGLVAAARDAVDADETVAGELVRAASSVRHGGVGLPPGHGGGR